MTGDFPNKRLIKMPVEEAILRALCTFCGLQSIKLSAVILDLLGCGDSNGGGDTRIVIIGYLIGRQWHNNGLHNRSVWYTQYPRCTHRRRETQATGQGHQSKSYAASMRQITPVRHVTPADHTIAGFATSGGTSAVPTGKPWISHPSCGQSVALRSRGTTYSRATGIPCGGLSVQPAVDPTISAHRRATHRCRRRSPRRQ